MKKLLLAGLLILGVSMVRAEGEPVIGPGVAPVIVPVVTQNVYYHVGALNLTVPWNDVNAVYMYDLNAKRNLVGGESVIATLWRVQATVGAVTSIDGHGAPFVGGNLWLPNPIPQLAVLDYVHPGVYGGYDWNSNAAIWGFKAAIPLFN